MPVILPGLTRHNLGTEILAGITLLAISLPLNIGYAQIAGLPPTAGLYALVLPSLVFAFLASSRHLVAAPDAAASALVGSALAGVAVAGTEQYATMAAAQAIVGGVMFVLCSVFRLGFLADFLSKPILVGFVAGLAIDILLGQAAKMLGISLPRGVDFPERLITLLGNLGSVQSWSLGLGLVVLALLVVGRAWLPRVPWALIALIAATVSSVLLNLPDHGVAVLGSVPSGPPVLAFPSLDWHDWVAVILPALAITTVSMGEGLLVARSYSDKYDYRTSPNRDLLAFGGANLASGLSSGFTIGSATSRAAAMDHAGSRTQLPMVILAGGALLLLIFGADLMADIPTPAIGAIVAVSVVKLISIPELRHLWRLSRFETLVAFSCLFGVLLLGPLYGIVLAFALSLINLLRKAARPAIDLLEGSEDPHVTLGVAHADAGETVPGVIAMRFAAPIFFGNAQTLGAAIRSAVRQAPNPVSAFILDMEGVTDVDVTGAEALAKELQWLQAKGITFAYTRVRPQLKENLARMHLLQGHTIFDTNRAAVAALRPVRDPAAHAEGTQPDPSGSS